MPRNIGLVAFLFGSTSVVRVYLPFANGLELCVQTARSHSVSGAECDRAVCTHNSKPFANGRYTQLSVFNVVKTDRNATSHRWIDPVKKAPTESELFETTNVQNLITILRQIQGEEMLIFDSSSFTEDSKYKGGKASKGLVLTMPKKQQKRKVKDDTETLHLKMTKSSIEQLKMGDPETLQRLVDVLEETKVIKLSKDDIEKIRLGDLKTIKEIKAAARANPRRSSRLTKS